MVEISFKGKTPYSDNEACTGGRIPIAIKINLFTIQPALFVNAMVDTGSEWNVWNGEIAQCYDLDPQEGSQVQMSTRLGKFNGRLVRCGFKIVGEEQESIFIEGTWFHCPEWPGPTVIGWTGALERLRFAVDPSESLFYFSEL